MEFLNEWENRTRKPYIDADEDHYSLQFRNKKGDIERDERGYKKNEAMTKLIYGIFNRHGQGINLWENRVVFSRFFCYTLFIQKQHFGIKN